MDVAEEARPVTGYHRCDREQDQWDGNSGRRFVRFTRATIRAAPEATKVAPLAAEGQDEGTEHVEGGQASRQECNGPQAVVAVFKAKRDDGAFAIEAREEREAGASQRSTETGARTDRHKLCQAAHKAHVLHLS